MKAAQSRRNDGHNSRIFFCIVLLLEAVLKDRRSGQKDSNFLVFRFPLAAAYSFARPLLRSWSSLLFVATRRGGSVLRGLRPCRTPWLI